MRAGRFELTLADGHPDVSLQVLDGVGPKTAERWQLRDIDDQRELLLLLPRRYRRLLMGARGADLVALEPENASFHAVVTSVRKPGRWGKRPLEVVVDSDGERVVLVWFNMRSSKFANAFRIGRWLEVDGTFDWSASLPKMAHPSVRWLPKEPEPTEPRTAFEPIYPGMDGVSPKLVRSAIVQAFERLAEHIVEVVPPRVRDELELPRAPDALAALHLLGPFVEIDDVDVLEATLERARQRLVYEEFYTLQTWLARKRSAERARARAPQLATREKGRELVRNLPFELTADQHAVAGLLAGELEQRVPMRRLLQGDVGSGKTVVAFMAAAIAAGSDAQTAIVAPTEVLANQHFANATAMLQPVGVRIALLTGAVDTATRKSVLADLRAGTVDVLVGTHALFSDDVAYDNLGLVVVDEQHKFGVDQRAALLAKGSDPHLLAMTATPIPRSVAHAVFGDLELAVLREKPPGREPVRTYLRDGSARGRVFEWLLDEVVGAGHQAYVVYPAIEPDARGFASLLDGAERLANGPLRGARLGVLHGKMGTDDKRAIMRRFAAGEVDVLCSTTVIEVGVDVPNATVMVIESPEAFGLSQLHQLRGRVGRGDVTSRCILLAGPRLTDEARQRLESLANIDDGFELAEIDFLMRGPGEFLGVRQAGAAEFRFGDLIRDREWLEAARRDARRELLGDVASNS